MIEIIACVVIGLSPVVGIIQMARAPRSPQPMHRCIENVRCVSRNLHVEEGR